MSTLDLCLLFVTLGGCLLGGWGIYWARGQDHPVRILWGQRLFTCTLSNLGLMTLVAAFARTQGLTLGRTESLNTSPAFIGALADLVRAHRAR